MDLRLSTFEASITVLLILIFMSFTIFVLKLSPLPIRVHFFYVFGPRDGACNERVPCL